MTRRSLSCLLALSVLLLSASTVAIGEASPVPLAVEVSIAPAAGSLGTYLCTARITDAAGEVVSEPEVKFLSGEVAKIRSGLQINGEQAEVLLTVSADSASHAAEVRVELVVGNSRSTLQALKLQL